MTMKKILIAGACALALCGQGHAEDQTLIWPKNSQFTCSGVLTVIDGELQLKPDSGAKVWCDATFEGEQAKRVRATCAEGERCQVKGIIMGHGAFYWVKITSVKTTE